MNAPAITYLAHNAVSLALHHLGGEPGLGRPLLLLHGLGEHSPATCPDWAARWSGPVYALDFTGHGASTVPIGGGYSAEVLMADADAALASIGPSTVVGRGLGAYIAVLIAGARPSLVRGTVLCDGPGMFGGGIGPTSPTVITIGHHGDATPDPWALAELARDVRPPDYAASFARAALQLSGVAWPFAVCARWRPPWLDAVAAEPGVLDVGLDEAIDFYNDLV
jgi:pimeloyl-ACP methyl ester carboxylesterase